MITADKIEKAEARCIELANDGPAHATYSKYFEAALIKYGAAHLRSIATDCCEGLWNVAGKCAEHNSWVLDIRTKHGFERYNGKNHDTEFSRMVFGYVLDHWLRSNACSTPSPAEKQMMEESVPYTPIKDDPAPPSHLDRAIAEQRSYYSSTTKETAMSLKIETITFVNGSDISKLTVDSLVSLISSTEKEIEKLEALNSKPKKVLAKINELKTGLAELVKHADAE